MRVENCYRDHNSRKSCDARSADNRHLAWSHLSKTAGCVKKMTLFRGAEVMRDFAAEIGGLGGNRGLGVRSPAL